MVAADRNRPRRPAPGDRPGRRTGGRAEGVGMPGGSSGKAGLWSPYRVLATALLVILSLHTASGIMCVQCDTETGNELCDTDPPPPENCTSCVAKDGLVCASYSTFNFCVTVRKFDENDTLLSVSRSCSPIRYTSVCMPGTDKARDDSQVKMCYSVCASDGCNHATLPELSVAAILVFLTLSLLVNVFKERW